MSSVKGVIVEVSTMTRIGRGMWRRETSQTVPVQKQSQNQKPSWPTEGGRRSFMGPGLSLGAFVLVVGMTLAACTSSNGTTGANNAAGSTKVNAPGGSGPTGTSSGSTPPAPDPGAPTSTATGPNSTSAVTPPSTVVVPTIVPAPQATGSDDVSKASAVIINTCMAKRECSGINAPKVEWPGVTLAQVDLSYAVLTGADLRGMQAPLGKIFGASMSGADLSGANLSGANLSGSDLSGATLFNTNFAGANLRGVILRNAIDDGADYRSAKFCQTIMPNGNERNDNC